MRKHGGDVTKHRGDITKHRGDITNRGGDVRKPNTTKRKSKQITAETKQKLGGKKFNNKYSKGRKNSNMDAQILAAHSEGHGINITMISTIIKWFTLSRFS